MIPRHTVIKLLKVSEMRKSEKQPKWKDISSLHQQI
jgi:hypothetical protein